jgi:uncharacterized protein YdeI (YjbR/CyaY-like superfamily)
MKPENVDQYIEIQPSWREALVLLREIFLETTLQESVKWGMPVYTLNGKNVAGFSAFKSHVGIWFYQGVFLKDREKKLINAQEGITKALRQWRFGSADEIRNSRSSIRAYLLEAIENQQKGKEMKPERNNPVELPRELARELERNAVLKRKFEDLTAGRQREYALYIASAKRVETRQDRLVKIVPMILSGAGLNDRYNK